MPNILFVVIDCARSDKWLGPGRTCQTPVLDRLAEQSLTFPTTITEKSCTTPSFCGMLTGAFSTRHGVSLVWGYQLPATMPMLTDAFAAAGYHTYAEMTGPLVPEMGLARGFQQYTYRSPCDYLHTAWGDRFVERLRNGYYAGPWFVMLHLWEIHLPRQVRPEFDSDLFGLDPYERAVSSLDAQLERVFAAAGDDAVIAVTGDHGEKTRLETYRPGTAVSYTCDKIGVDQSSGLAADAIANWAGPAVMQQLYGQGQTQLEGISLSDFRAASRESFWTRLRDRLRLLRLTPWVWAHEWLALGRPLRQTELMKKRGFLDPKYRRARVDRFIRSLGSQRLLEMHMRLWRNTYRLQLDEGHIVHVYDYLTRVPLILRWPNRGHSAGRRMDRMVRLIDVLPTLLDLLGQPWQVDDTDAHSFAPLIRDENWSPPPAFLSVSGLPRELVLHGVRTETHRYTYGPHNAEFPEELYALCDDLDETTNRAMIDPARCAELRTLCESMIPQSGPARGEAMALDAEQQRIVEQRLQELGYIE